MQIPKQFFKVPVISISINYYKSFKFRAFLPLMCQINVERIL